ncbi:hypothetical protein Tco_0916285 [Tanacetum coccineum]
MRDTISRTRFENVSKTSNDSLLVRVNTPQSDEDRLKLNELMEFCTKLQQRVLDLENTKTAQNQEITSLKLRVGRSARVISSNEASLGDQEDASKQERKIDDIDKDAEITLVHETQGSAKVQEKANVVKEPSESITTTKTLTTTASITIIAVSTRPKAKGLVIHEEEQATTPIVSSQNYHSLDEELAFKLQAKEEKEERLVREKAQREEEANILSWDNVQAMIDVDYQMAQQQMQAEEQEELSIEEKSKLFVQLLEARKKHFAGNGGHNQLKNKSFNDIQKLFDKAMKRVNTFVDIDTELVEGSKVRAKEDKETAELQRLIEVVPDKEEVAIDAIPCLYSLQAL